MRTCRTVLVGVLLSGLLIATGQAAPHRQGKPGGAGGQLGGSADSAEGLEKEISSLNLINALNLTREQMQQIINLIDRLDDIQKAYEQRVAASTRESEPLLKDLKAILEKQQQIPDDLERKVGKATEGARKVRSEMETQLALAAEGIDEILTEGQQQVIADFQPCVLPPRNLSDPVRAGQASQSGIGEELLRRIRQMPDREFRMHAQRIVDKGIARVAEHHGKFTDEERTTERKRLLALVQKVRGLSDVEFEMQKDDLTREFKPKQKIKELQDEMEKARAGVGISKAAHVLLNPAAVSVLRKRAKQMDVAVND